MDCHSYFLDLDLYSNNFSISNICNELLNNFGSEDHFLLYGNFITFLYNKKEQYKITTDEYIKIKYIIEIYSNQIHEFLIVQNYKEYILSNYKNENEIDKLFYKLLVIEGLFNYKVDYYDYYMLINNNLDLLKNKNELVNEIIKTILNYLNIEKKRNIDSFYLFFSILTLKSLIVNNDSFNNNFKKEFFKKFKKFMADLVSNLPEHSYKKETIQNNIKQNLIVISKSQKKSIIKAEFEENQLSDNLEYIFEFLNFKIGSSKKKRIVLILLFEMFNCIQYKYKRYIENIVNTNKQFIKLPISEQALLKEYMNLTIDHGLFKYSSFCNYLEYKKTKELYFLKYIPYGSFPLLEIIKCANKINEDNSYSNQIKIKLVKLQKIEIYKLLMDIENHIKISDSNNTLNYNYNRNNNNNNNGNNFDGVNCFTYMKELPNRLLHSIYSVSYDVIKNKYSLEESLDYLFFNVDKNNNSIKKKFIQDNLNDLICNLNIDLISKYITPIFDIENNSIYNNKLNNRIVIINNSDNSNKNVELPEYIIKNIIFKLFNDENDRLLASDKLKLSLVNKSFFKTISNLIYLYPIIINDKLLSTNQSNSQWSILKLDKIVHLKIVCGIDRYYNKALNNLIHYKSLETIELDGSFNKSIHSDFIYLLKHPTLKTIILNCEYIDILQHYSEIHYYENNYNKTFKINLTLNSQSSSSFPQSFIDSIQSLSIQVPNFFSEYFNKYYHVKTLTIRESFDGPFPSSGYSEQECISKYKNLESLCFQNSTFNTIFSILKSISKYTLNLSELIIIPLACPINPQKIFDLFLENNNNFINLPNLKKITFKSSNNYSLSYNWDSIDFGNFKSLDNKYKTFYKISDIYNNYNSNSDSENNNHNNLGNSNEFVKDTSFKNCQNLEIDSVYFDRGSSYGKNIYENNVLNDYNNCLSQINKGNPNDLFINALGRINQLNELSSLMNFNGFHGFNGLDGFNGLNGFNGFNGLDNMDIPIDHVVEQNNLPFPTTDYYPFKKNNFDFY